MRNDVSVVDHSKSFRNALSDIGGKSFITYSGFSIGIKLIAMAEKIVDIEAGNCCQS